MKSIGVTLYRVKKSENFNQKLAPKFFKSKILEKVGNCYYKICDLDDKVIGTYHTKHLKSGKT